MKPTGMTGEPPTERRGPAVHPLLFALIPVLALYLNNLDQVAPADALLPVLSALLFALLVYLGCGLLVRPFTKAAVLSSALVFLFFTYGHVRIALKAVWPRQSDLSGIILFVLVAALMVLTVIYVRRLRRTLELMSAVMNVVAAVMVVTLLVPIVAQESRAARITRRHAEPESASLLARRPQATSPGVPDIYFIVLDRYPGLSMARELYGFDNQPFLDFLSDLGFYVAESSACNYARTDMSLASTLNADYVGPDYQSAVSGLRRRLLHERIQDGSVWRRLRGAGYEIRHLGTWWRSTRVNRQADVNINYGLLSEFFMEFYKTTLLYPVGALLDLGSHREQWMREQVKFAYLDTAALPESPVFVFAHFLLPHDPYVFASDGGYQGRLRQIRIGVEDGFVGQLEYVNERLRHWVSEVVQDTSRASIIILQSDEGPRAPENFSARDASVTLSARFQILTAYRFPDADCSTLYQSISSVNTFRLVFAKVFGDSANLLPDLSFECDRGACRDVTGEIWR